MFDRALARQPDQRYATANDLVRDIRSLSTHLTGAVDVEAGTQVVRQEDLKSAVPATRVDPQAARDRARAPAATQPIKAAPATRSVPVVPVVVAVALLAAGGGAYAMRDTLFGERGSRTACRRPIPPRR